MSLHEKKEELCLPRFMFFLYLIQWNLFYFFMTATFLNAAGQENS